MKKNSKKTYNGRDPLIVKLINGATKAAVHKDKKKESNKHKCRKTKGKTNETP